MKYLFGTVAGEFADQNLFDSRRSGQCLTCGPDAGTDLRIGPGDSWTDICAKLPADWQPDFIALWLPYTEIPAEIWAAPVPLIGLAADWNLQFHHYRSAILKRCDAVLVDTPGVAVLRQAGFDHVRPANLFGLERAFLELPDDEDERTIDVLFVGNLHEAVQRERMPWLGRLARLADRWTVRIASGVFGDDYRALLRRSRIVLNRSIHGECKKGDFRSPSCGCLLFEAGEHCA